VQLVGQLKESEFVESVAIIYIESAATESRPAESFIHRVYRRLDELAQSDPAQALVAKAWAGSPSQANRFATDCEAMAIRVPASAVQLTALASRRLDVIVALGPASEAVELAAVSRFGIWSCRLGNPIYDNGRTFRSWQLIEWPGAFSIYLDVLLSGRLSPQILSIGTMPLASKVSVLRSIAVADRMSATLIISKLRQLHSEGWEYVLAQCPPSRPHVDTCGTCPSAGNLQILRTLSRQALRFARRKVTERKTREHWTVGIRSNCRLQGLAAACTPQGFKWITAPGGHFYADPFLMSHAGQSYLFVEDYDVELGRGVISCMKVESGGEISSANIVLKRPYHLSYPYVFVHEDGIFMIPETGFNNTVELYRAVDFPNRWELVKVLFGGPAFDTTVLYHEARFWFFVTLLDVRYSQAAILVLFHSQTLLGEWTLHPGSPISADVRTARGAGMPFLDRGTWIRPAQDGSETYGGAIRYQRILRIDTNHYAEEFAGALTPDLFPGSEGTHTYNRDSGIEVIDLKLRIARDLGSRRDNTVINFAHRNR
jgi:hypothetical protein